ncbi:MAG: response regulator [Candidatus Zixiibacteriota bacterium]
MFSKNAIIVGQQDIADDLRFGLGKPENGWNLKFVASGAEAISELNDNEYEFVLSELVLPDQDVASLFEQIRENHPGIVRFVLSANDNREIMMRATSQAHQAISKPVKADTLRMQISNSLALRGVLTDEKLHSRIAKISSLPTLPTIYNQLVLEMQSENASMQKVANLIKQDVSITAKLLQMTNSAFFGLSSRVENPLQAANLLGMDTVKSLVLTAGVFSQFNDPGLPGFSIDTIYNHSLAVGASARHFANAFGLGRKQAEDALMAGMLHDIGKLVLLTNFHDELSQSISLAQKENLPMHEAERRILGVSHCEIGAHLLSLWGMSDLILEAVTLHDTPKNTANPMVNILASVHIANAFDHDQNMPERDPKFTHADMDYLTRLGLNTQVPYLRTLAGSSK